jgi:hypothetical protein
MTHDVLLSLVTSTGPVSGGIRWGTHSKYSHAEWLMSEGCYAGRRLGARADGGVQIRPGDYAKFTHELLISVPMSEKQYRDWETFMYKQLDKHYDFTAVFAFAFPFLRRQDWRNDTHWFCSELMTAGFEWVGVYNGKKLVLPYNAVSPGDCALVTAPFGDIIYEY